MKTNKKLKNIFYKNMEKVIKQNAFNIAKNLTKLELDRYNFLSKKNHNELMFCLYELWLINIEDIKLN